MTETPRLHRLSVQRSARYFTLGGDGDVRSVWYVLHGYRQLADRFIERFRELASPARRIVAPEALNHFYLEDRATHGPHGPSAPVGATWMTRHDREVEIADYVAYLDRLDETLAPGRDVRRVVLGFSQGSQTAARWAVLGARPPHRLVLWGGVFPPDLDVAAHAARVAALEPVLIRSEQDESLAPAKVDHEVARLAALGIAATPVRHGGGHTIGRDALLDVARVVDAG